MFLLDIIKIILQKYIIIAQNFVKNAIKLIVVNVIIFISWMNIIKPVLIKQQIAKNMMMNLFVLNVNKNMDLLGITEMNAF